ncbi:hypothetical protein BDP81DRAFT_65330 [Colletotrichum phormii]|uniref:Uncharacterized protein n=1 Tax=Colletotrichum phormii TaxID=359342 RepID=A0AAI9ZLB0_9PEZI|nr:uncharacterized protein BDP81DRAFT_65330 [Colletotrichum phormii]KAK1634077.1 hypothetical protein BDP81DRAFT_65330 [Colletotrichum phormii]
MQLLPFTQSPYHTHSHSPLPPAQPQPPFSSHRSLRRISSHPCPPTLLPNPNLSKLGSPPTPAKSPFQCSSVPVFQSQFRGGGLPTCQRGRVCIYALCAWSVYECSCGKIARVCVCVCM